MANAQIDIVVRQKGAKEVKRNLEDIGKGADVATKAVGFLKTALLGIAGSAILNQLKNYADTWTQTTNQLRIATRSTAELVAVQEDLFNVAQKTRQSYTSTVSLYSRLNAAGKDLGKSQADIIKFTEGIGMALEIGGTSAQEAAGGLLQLGQALGSATIQAEEFNSLADSMPRVLRAVSEELGMEGSISRLKNAVKEGEVTSREFFDAFMKALPKIQEEFAKTTPTISSAFTQLNNAVTKYVGELDSASGISGAVAQSISFLAQNIEQVAAVAASAGVALLVAFSPKLVGYIKQATAAVRLFTVALAANPIGAIAVALSAVITYLVMFRDEIALSADGVVTLGDYLQATWEIGVEGAKAIYDAVTGFVLPGIDAANAAVNSITQAWAGVSSDVGTILKGLVNFSVGIMVGNVKAIIIAFEQLPGAIKDIFIQAINGMVSIVEGGLNKIIDGINTIREYAGMDPLEGFDLGRIENSAAGAARNLGSAIADAYRESLNTDFVGEASKALDTLSERARAIALQRQKAQADAEAAEALAREQMAQAGSAAALEEKDKKSKKHIKTLQEYLTEIRQEMSLLNLVGKEREIATQVMEIENALKEDGITLTKAQREELVQTITAYEDMLAVNREMENVWRDIKGPAEDYQSTLAALNKLQQQGKITAQEYGDALRRAQISYLDSKTDPTSGYQRGLLKVQETISDVASATENLVTNAFSNMEDSLVDFVTTGEFSIDKLVKGVLADSTRALFRGLMGQLTGEGGPLAGLFGNLTGQSQSAAGTAPAQLSAAGTQLSTQVTSAASTFASTVAAAANSVASSLGAAPGSFRAAQEAGIPQTASQAVNQLAGGSGGNAGGAVDLAMNYLGQHESRNTGSINSFLKAGGVDLNAAQTAWCAAFVNSSLSQLGINGSGSQVATSFLNWGTKVNPADVMRGDVLVESRGKAAGQTGGHVGFATGNSRMGSSGLELEMLSGNSNNQVMLEWINAQQLQVRRAMEQSHQQQLAMQQQFDQQKLTQQQTSAQQELTNRQMTDQQKLMSEQQTTMAAQQAAPAQDQLRTAIQGAGTAAQSASPSIQQAGQNLQSAAAQAQTAAPSLGNLQQGIGSLLGPLSQAIPGLGQFGGAIMQLLSSLGGMGGGGGGLGGLLTQGLGLFAGGFATGGSFTVPGSGAPDSKLVSMALTPGEKVTVQTPSQQQNSSGENVTVSPTPIRVVNVIDPNEALSALGSNEGERIILNTIQRNPSAIKRLLS